MNLFVTTKIGNQDSSLLFRPHPAKSFIIGDSDPLSFRACPAKAGRGSAESLNIGEVVG
jgi:hypothetical protein